LRSARNFFRFAAADFLAMIAPPFPVTHSPP
jgi:hypothetical protein